MKLREVVNKAEKQAICREIIEQGSVQKAAASLGVSRFTIYHKLKEWGVYTARKRLRIDHLRNLLSRDEAM